jgi:hypothetical protein
MNLAPVTSVLPIDLVRLLNLFGYQKANMRSANGEECHIPQKQFTRKKSANNQPYSKPSKKKSQAI